MNNNLYWMYVENTKSDINELLEMFWGFHDFRVVEIIYSAEKDRVDVILEYDTRDLRVNLRFMGDVNMNFVPTMDFEADWISGSSMSIDEHFRILWVNDEINESEPIPSDLLWIRGNTLNYAVVNSDNEPVQLPYEIIHQKLCIFGKESERHYSPKYL